MPHHTPLIATIVAGLVLAFLLGAIANRLRISPLVGYVLAGVAVGPHTPGFVADQALANELAEIGVILLMFGVGMHFSLRDLLSVKAIAIPGAAAQMTVATALGIGLASLLGWSFGAGLVFGLALSVASTVVLLRALQERRLLDSNQGRIAVGWLIVEDLAMVLALVLLPAVASLLSEPEGNAQPLTVPALLETLGVTLGKVAAFVVLMLVVGRRIIPWALHYIARTGSRELFRLAVLTIGLGVAYGASEFFGVSFALGAFFAGMVLNESELSHRAAEETLPLRDAFAVLFFVSVGMLFTPAILVESPLVVLATFAIIVIGKSLAAFLIVLAFRHPLATAMTISASLAQIGEFSFILAALGVSLGLLPEEARDLILAGAILSILANPLFFAALDHLCAWLERREGKTPPPDAPKPEQPASELPVTSLTDHTVVVGYGRVGSLVAEGLSQADRPFLVIEERSDLVQRAREKGFEVVAANAAQPGMLNSTNLPAARLLVVAIPDAFEAGTILSQARAANPQLEIIARAHSDVEVEHLNRQGASSIVMGEREIARAMLARALRPGAAAEEPPPGPESGPASDSVRPAEA